MPKPAYFVIKNGRVAYPPGHYDIEGARATAQTLLHTQLLDATIHIVKVVETFTVGPRKGEHGK